MIFRNELRVKRMTEIDMARNQRPIDIALRNNDPTMVGFLLAHGAEYTLDLAAQDGDVETVRRLCRSRTSRRHRGGQALTIAARAGQAKLVRALVRGGVEPTQPVPDAPRGAALWHAAAQGHLAIAEMLLEAGADPNAWIESSGAPIHQAKDDAMKALLYRYGAKAKNAADFVLGDDIDALRVLIEHDPAAVAGAGCGSVYTFAVAFNKVAALDLLLSSGIPVPPVVTECRTYLWRRPELARRLLAAGMDPNLPNWQWQTPLHNIAEMNPMWVRKGRNSPVQRRERAHRQTLVDLFLEFGADIDAVDEEYRSTPLGWAARQGQDDVVELLLERGADPSGGEAWARPHAWAERRKHGKIARRLKRAGAR
jgi:ankyrin repeat protein